MSATIPVLASTIAQAIAAWEPSHGVKLTSSMRASLAEVIAQAIADRPAYPNPEVIDTETDMGDGAPPAPAPSAPEPLYKEIECILDEHSAWVARPNAEVTRAIALKAALSAMQVMRAWKEDDTAPCAASFQDRVKPWMDACFGPEISADRIERNHRFLEEALETVQSTGCTASEAHQLVDYVFGRPAGDPRQEVGGVMVTLAALCLANGLDMAEAGETELARVWTKVDAIRAKQAAKPKHSPLPGPSEPAPAPQGDGWRPIARLPDDDSLILAWCPPDDRFPDARMMIWKAAILAQNLRGPTPRHLQFPATLYRPLADLRPDRAPQGGER